MRKKNPAWSGDQIMICWMDLSKGDFYYDEYRSLESQIEIFELALLTYGDTLRMELNKGGLAGPTTFKSNLRKYLGGCALRCPKH
jgi:hypothetical protein